MPKDKQPKPFHESILEIFKSRRYKLQDREILGCLILSTEIRANHDQIINAWKSSFELRGGDQLTIDVVKSVLQQKEAIAVG